MKNFLRDVGLDSEAGLKPAGIFRNAGIFDDAGLFISTISFLSDGYYFFDAQTLSAGNVTPWDGSLPDSPNDLGLIATQTTSGNQPTADGTVVIFDSNSEHYDIPSTSQAGWQIVGTSLGTFAYKVDADAITELNLLGNLGGTAFRKEGDLYGIILLPDTATAAQVEAARQLLVSRGAADGVTTTSLSYAWRERADIVEFRTVDTSSVTRFHATWYNCNSLTSFPLIDTSLATNLSFAWFRCTSLESFPAGMFDSWNASSIANSAFDRTWEGCTSLTPQSVENILVSIAASGKYATISGASGGTALTDPEIDIDYDGTGLTTATSAAIETLNGRGWAVKINGEIIVPNILQLQPAAAYSLRSFDSAADPNVVNVRRSSDGATSDFTASEVSDGTLVAFVGAGNDGHVTTWYDQSGSGNNSTQSTASSQPLIVENGVLVTENGEPTLSFDGTSDFMETDGYIVELSQNPASVFAVASPNSGSQDGHYLMTEGDAVSPYSSQFVLNSNVADAALWVNSTTFGQPLLALTQGMVGFIYDGTNFQAYRDGSASGTSGTAGINQETSINTYIGSSADGSTFFFSGRISEIVTFKNDQSANRTGIEKNINDHYSIY